MDDLSRGEVSSSNTTDNVIQRQENVMTGATKDSALPNSTNAVSVKSTFAKKLLCHSTWCRIIVGLCLTVFILSVVYTLYSYYLGAWSVPVAVEVTNVTDRSVTVSWVTGKEVPGAVIYSERDSFFPWLFAKSGKKIAYDDRDVVSARKLAAERSAQKLTDAGDEVLFEEFTEDVYLEEVGSYYVHHVTISGLNPETEYFFMVGNGLRFSKEGREVGDHSFTTVPMLNSIAVPVPAYGIVRLWGDEKTPVTDGIMYVNIKTNEEYSRSVSAILGENGSWYVDLSNVRNEDGTVYLSGLSTDSYTEVLTVESGIFGKYQKEISSEDDSPAAEMLVSDPELELNQPDVRYIGNTVKTSLVSFPFIDAVQANDCGEGGGYPCSSCDGCHHGCNYNPPSGAKGSCGYMDYCKDGCATAPADPSCECGCPDESIRCSGGKICQSQRCITPTTPAPEPATPADGHCHTGGGADIANGFCGPSASVCWTGGYGGGRDGSCSWAKCVNGQYQSVSDCCGSCATEPATPAQPGGGASCPSGFYSSANCDGKCSGGTPVCDDSRLYSGCHFCNTKATPPPDTTPTCSGNLVDFMGGKRQLIGCGQSCNCSSGCLCQRSGSAGCGSCSGTGAPAYCDTSDGVDFGQSCPVASGVESVPVVPTPVPKPTPTPVGTPTPPATPSCASGRYKTSLGCKSGECTDPCGCTCAPPSRYSCGDPAVNTVERGQECPAVRFVSNVNQSPQHEVLISRLSERIYAQEGNSAGTGIVVMSPSAGVYSFSDVGTYCTIIEVNRYCFDIASAGPKILYIDVDENSTFNEGDINLANDVVELSVRLESSTKIYNIKLGFNLVSFNLVAAEGSDMMASKVLERLNNEYHDAFYSIAGFENGRWVLVGNRDGVAYGGDDFQIIPGRGYLLKSKTTFEMMVSGKLVVSPVPVTLVSGWNLAAIHGTDSPYTASSWLDSIDMVNGLDADNVTRWDVTRSVYSGLQKEKDAGGNMEIYGFDFPIEPLGGYFIRIASGNGTWTPEADE